VNDASQDLQLVLDEASIRRVLYAYCRAADRGDLGALREVYHSDAFDDHTGVYSGDVDGFIAFMERSLTAGVVTCTRHCLSNILIEVEGDVAVVESYFEAFHRRSVDGIDIDEDAAGRYLDRFERRHGQWRIAARRVVWDRPPHMPSTAKIGGETSILVGLRSSDDASVAWFRDRGPVGEGR
jgi:ketosteroid isomerase-like protein